MLLAIFEKKESPQTFTIPYSDKDKVMRMLEEKGIIYYTLCYTEDEKNDT